MPPVLITSPQRSAARPGQPPKRSRRLPGGRVVTLATLVVVAVAVAEALILGTVGVWTGATLVVVAVAATLATRAGDRSLPAMMPPLAFLMAVLAGTLVLQPPSATTSWTSQALLLLQLLGRNAAWVVGATLIAVVLATIGHVHDRRSARRAAAT